VQFISQDEKSKRLTPL